MDSSIYILQVLPTVLFLFCATIRFTTIRDMALARNQHSRAPYILNYLLVLPLIALICYGMYENPPLYAIFEFSQLIGLVGEIWLTRMHQIRNMPYSMVPWYTNSLLFFTSMLAHVIPSSDQTQIYQFVYYMAAFAVTIVLQRYKDTWKHIKERMLVKNNQNRNNRNNLENNSNDKNTNKPDQESLLSSIYPEQFSSWNEFGNQQKISVVLKPSIKVQSNEAYFQFMVTIPGLKDLQSAQGTAIEPSDDDPELASSNSFKVMRTVEQLLQLTEYLEAVYGFVRVDLSSDLWAASAGQHIQARLVKMQMMTVQIDTYFAQIIQQQKLVDERVLKFLGVEDQGVVQKVAQRDRPGVVVGGVKVQQPSKGSLAQKGFGAQSEVAIAGQNEVQEVNLVTSSYEVNDDNETEVVYTLRLTQELKLINSLSSTVGQEQTIKVSWSKLKKVLKQNGIQYKKGPEVDKASRVTQGIKDILNCLPHASMVINQWEVQNSPNKNTQFGQEDTTGINIAPDFNFDDYEI